MLSGMGTSPDAMMGAVSAGQATHKVPLRSARDVDDEVRHLLRVAYEQGV